MKEFDIMDFVDYQLEKDYTYASDLMQCPTCGNRMTHRKRGKYTKFAYCSFCGHNQEID